MSVMQWNEQAKEAIENGFSLIPLRHTDKRPLLRDWTSFTMNSEDVEQYAHCGFGILCGKGEYSIYAFDVDSTDQKVTDEFISVFELHHGTPIIRIGQKPKILIPFRMAKAGVKKKKSPESHQGHLDILGYGQFFVAYNIHPKTKQEYTWSKPPHEFKAEELPLLDEEAVEYFFEFFQSLTTPKVKAKKEVQPAKQGKNGRNRTYTNREITAFLSCFGEEFTNGTHDEWIPVVMAVHHETRGSNKGKELARRWSKRGSSYDEENFNYKWSTFDCEEEGDSEKKRSTFASLFYHHRKLIPDGLLCDRFTDAYSSALFSICNRGNYLYVESLGGWFVREKHLWNPPNKETKESMVGVVARFLIACGQDATDLEEWSEARKITEKQIAKSTGMPAKKSPRDAFKASFKSEKVTSITKAKNTVTSLEAGRTFRIPADKVGCDERYLGDSDGIIDLETGKRVSYSSKLIITKSTGTPFVEGKPSQELISLVSSYFESEEVMNFFLRCVGMALLGGNEAQKFIHIHGSGGTGKSTLMKLLKLAFGNQYVTSMQASDIMQSHTVKAGGANPSIIDAFGSRIVVINETNERDEVNSAMIKQITGGDEISARQLWSGKYIKRKASFTPFIITNKPLFITGVDDAIWRRMITIPLNNKVKTPDPTLESRLKEYAPDAKRWFLQGVKDYIQRGHDLTIPQECLEATAKARRDLDTYQAWIDDCCEVGKDLWEEQKLLAKSYSEYLREEMNYSQKHIPTSTVVRNLETKGFKESAKWENSRPNRGKCFRVILGLKLKPAFEAVEDEPSNVIDFKK